MEIQIRTEKNPTNEINMARLTEASMHSAEMAKADNTKKAYKRDWDHFMEWCSSYNVAYLPADPNVVANYVTDLKEHRYKASTIQRRLSAISQAHQMAGYDSPTKTNVVRIVWAGVRREIGTAQKGKSPAVIDDVRLMVNSLPDTLLGVRDRALLLVGFAGAFRRSELVSLNVDDVEITREGLVVYLRKSKTDQEGEGRKIGIPYGSHPDTCPVRALEDWLEEADIQSGPLFRALNRHGQILGERRDKNGRHYSERLSDKAVARVVKRTAEAAGLDSTKYAGHSLRAGLATSAAVAGVSERAIMAQTGHKSVNMVRRYIREGNLFRENAAASVGL